MSILTGLERTVHLEDPDHTLEPAGLNVSHAVVTKGSFEVRSWRSILRLPNDLFCLRYCRRCLKPRLSARRGVPPPAFWPAFIPALAQRAARRIRCRELAQLMGALFAAMRLTASLIGRVFRRARVVPLSLPIRQNRFDVGARRMGSAVDTLAETRQRVVRSAFSDGSVRAGCRVRQRSGRKRPDRTDSHHARPTDWAIRPDLDAVDPARAERAR